MKPADHYKRLQKEFRIDSQKLRDSAKGQRCTFEVVDICMTDEEVNYESTVLCHSGAIDDGKSKARKGSDFYAAFGCVACHEWFDDPSNDEKERLFYFHRAMKRTQKVWVQMGLVVILSMKK